MPESFTNTFGMMLIAFSVDLMCVLSLIHYSPYPISNLTSCT